MLAAITPYAAIISAGSALLSAIAVLISTWFIIWTTYFRKTRRDRIDELKEEMQVLLGGRSLIHISERESFLQSLDSKYNTPKYEKLHSVAFAELIHEGRLELRWSHS